LSVVFLRVIVPSRRDDCLKGQAMQPFMFATGIENSYPTILLPDGTRKRVDEMEKCGHYQRWRGSARSRHHPDRDLCHFGVPETNDCRAIVRS
jgi:hypothetical protein